MGSVGAVKVGSGVSRPFVKIRKNSYIGYTIIGYGKSVYKEITRK